MVHVRASQLAGALVHKVEQARTCIDARRASQQCWQISRK
jgi:hypothetical protein